MKQFLKQIFPKEFYKDKIYFLALLFMVVYLATLLGQLFKYEDFADVVRKLNLIGGDITVVIFIAVMPIVTAVSLPFLVSMKLTPMTFKLSRTAVVLTPILWILTALSVAISGAKVSNIGLFGDSLAIAGSWLLLGLLFVWLFIAVIFAKKIKRI